LVDNGKTHSFTKNGSNFHKKNGDKSNNGKKNNGHNHKPKSDCGNSVFPMGICAKCQKFLEQQKHHILPKWIVKAIISLGMSIDENNDKRTIDLCPRHHRKGIERINQRFAALILINYKKQYAEIAELFVKGKDHFTIEELTVLVNGGSLKKETTGEYSKVKTAEVES
jgi:hypothetical protein